MQLGLLEHRGIKLSWRQKQGRGPLQSRPGEPWELPAQVRGPQVSRATRDHLKPTGSLPRRRPGPACPLPWAQPG